MNLQNSPVNFGPIAVPQQDRDAMELWRRTGTVTQEYLRKTLGDPMQTVSPNAPLVLRAGDFAISFPSGVVVTEVTAIEKKESGNIVTESK